MRSAFRRATSSKTFRVRAGLILSVMLKVTTKIKQKTYALRVNILQTS